MDGLGRKLVAIPVFLTTFACVKTRFIGYGALLLLLLTALSCGSARKMPAQAQGQPPLEDPVEIARARQRAREVLDSIARARPDMPADSLAVLDTTILGAELPLADQIIAFARTFTGVPYRLGAAGPKEFDCSGFTSYVYKHFGYNLTKFSVAQFKEGREVPSFSDIQKGDLVFFGKRDSVRDIGHVGIVVSIDRERGSFRFIHASVSRGVTEDDANHPYFMMRYMGARRFLPDEPAQ